jgi:hypothetical protein
VPSEVGRITAFEAFKALSERVWTMRPEEKDVIDKMQPEAELLKSRIEEVLFKESHEQVGIRKGHSCAPIAHPPFPSSYYPLAEPPNITLVSFYTQ